MKATMTTIALATAAFLGACATTSAPPSELVRARNTVHQAAMDSQVLASAPLELKKATGSLDRANALLAQGESLAEVTSAALVADRQAQTAMALADAKRNEQAIASAQVERERARADAKEVEARRAKLQAAQAQIQAGVAQSQAQAARQQVMTAEQRANAAQAAAVGAQQQAASAEQRAAAARQEAATLARQMADMQAKETERGLLVTLGDVLFEFGRAEVKPSAQGALQKLADFLQQHPDRTLRIEGFTDSVGSDAANVALSQRRADAVARSLQALGVDPSRIQTKGYGESYPVADNTSSTNRALNRRVEVYISSNDRPVSPRS